MRSISLLAQPISCFQEPAMQTLLSLLAPAVLSESHGRLDDRRDKWVGLLSAFGLCALAAIDLISLL